MIQFVSNRVFLRLAWIQLGSAPDDSRLYCPESKAKETVKYIYTCCRRCAWTEADNQSLPKSLGLTEREWERCPLLKLRYTGQGHPSLRLTTLTKKDCRLNTTTFWTPFFFKQSWEKKQQTQHTHKKIDTGNRPSTREWTVA